MEQLVSTFHIDFKLLIAQAINFGLVVFVLYKFAYKPLLKHMNDRSDVIEKGLNDAKKAQEELEKAESLREEKIQEAKRDAKKILEDAQKQAETNKETIVAEAKKETEKVVEKAKEQIAYEKQRMIKEVKEETSELVVMAVEKVLGSKIDVQADQQIINQSIDQLKK